MRYETTQQLNMRAEANKSKNSEMHWWKTIMEKEKIY